MCQPPGLFFACAASLLHLTIIGGERRSGFLPVTVAHRGVSRRPAEPRSCRRARARQGVAWRRRGRVELSLPASLDGRCARAPRRAGRSGRRDGSSIQQRDGTIRQPAIGFAALIFLSCQALGRARAASPRPCAQYLRIRSHPVLPRLPSLSQCDDRSVLSLGRHGSLFWCRPLQRSRPPRLEVERELTLDAPLHRRCARARAGAIDEKSRARGFTGPLCSRCGRPNAGGAFPQKRLSRGARSCSGKK